MFNAFRPFSLLQPFRVPPLGDAGAIPSSALALALPLQGSLLPSAGTGTLTHTRATSAWMWRDSDGRMWRDYAAGRVLTECPAGELRFEGARREAGGVYYNTLSDGTPIPASEIKAVVEQQATNLFSTTSLASFTKVGCTVSGATDSFFNITATATNWIRAQLSAATTVGTVYTVSAVFKAATANCHIGHHNASGGSLMWVRFDLSGPGAITQTYGGAVGSITHVGNSEYLCTMTFTATLAGPYITFGPSDGTVIDSFPASASGAAVYCKNPMLRLGSVNQTFIPTTSASVTRNADQLVLTNYTLPASGSLYFEAEARDWAQVGGQLFGDGTEYLLKPLTTQSGVQAFDGTNTANGPTGTPSGMMRFAIRWDSVVGKMRLAANGSLGTEANYDGNWNLASYILAGGFDGAIRNLRTYDRALTDAQMQSLTR